MGNIRYTLTKDERLCKKKAIDALFKGGNTSFAAFPFRVVFVKTEKSETSAKILISVPKHRYRHAVDRNRMKRLVRESYRLQKARLWSFLESKDYGIDIAIICISDRKETYKTVYKSIDKTISRICEKLSKESQHAVDAEKEEKL